MEAVSDADYELIELLNICFHSQLLKEAELNAFLLKLLWEREDDPPLWAAELIDEDEKQKTAFRGPAKVSQTYPVFTRDEKDAIWAMSVLRRHVPDDPEPGEKSNAALFAAYRRNPHIVARFRALFPDIAWDEPPEA